MKDSNNNGNLNRLRKEIQVTQLLLIISVTLLLSAGGIFINIHSTENSFDQNLQNTSMLLANLYSQSVDMKQDELCSFMDGVTKKLKDVDVVSIVDSSNNRIYHSNHELINTQYTGTHPDFNSPINGYFTEDSTGPSGFQRRSYAAIYTRDGRYKGFLMTIQLKKSIREIIFHIVLLFLVVTLSAILIELAICATLSKKIKKQFMDFTEDFEGTRFLVDSMRANNHDFTNKLHVILGLIQIGQYEKAQSYIQNISIIQRETVSSVMHAIDNPSFAALLIGKIARASECNVKFLLKEGSCYKSEHIDIPSDALVTISGNLIDNALDSMNASTKEGHELSLGVYTKPGQMLLIVQDTGEGIPKDIQEKIFLNGFSTKGTGRGIGLYHTSQLIKSLGGSIIFETEVGKGTCFTVILKDKNFLGKN